MADIEIKRGYEVLPDNNIRFGIRITNISDLAISDVEVTLDYPKSLFNLEGNRIQNLGNIPPEKTHTAEFVLKPLGCVHQVNIEALLSYRDAKWNRQRVDMHPKEVHCVCPFLKGKAMPRAEFLELSNSGHSAETGLNFKGISVERLASYLVQTCKSRHHKVDDYPVDGGRMLYLASESIGEKAYYLLTALIKEDDGLTQVMLRVASDKSHGLNGFLNETVAELRHVISTVQSAQEIGIIKKQQVINIIDSIVQRSNFGGVGGEGGASVNIQDSVVQRTKFNVGEDKKADEERLRKEKEQLEIERKEKETEEKLRKQKEKKAQEYARLKQEARDEQKRITKQKSKTRTNIFMLAIIFGAMFFGFVMFAPSSNDLNDVPLSYTQPEKVIDSSTSDVATSRPTNTTDAMDSMTETQPLSIAYNAGDIEANPYTYSRAEISGKVVDIINSGGYSYIQLDDGTGKVWAAIPQTNINQGTEGTVLGSIMTDFSSSTLGKTFTAIIFSDGMQTSAVENPTNAYIIEKTDPELYNNSRGFFNN